MHRLFFIFVVAAYVGCTPHQHSTPSGQLDKNRVIEIACLGLSTNAGFRKDKVSFDVSRNGDKWWVTIWTEPKMPGRFCTVEITADGMVQHIYQGK